MLLRDLFSSIYSTCHRDPCCAASLKYKYVPCFCRGIQDNMGSIKCILDPFRSPKALVDIPKAWKQALESSPEATAWYPAHVSCQVQFTSLEQLAGHFEMQRLAIPLAGSLVHLLIRLQSMRLQLKKSICFH